MTSNNAHVTAGIVMVVARRWDNEVSMEDNFRAAAYYGVHSRSNKHI